MRVPLEWLKEYVAVRLKPAELAHRLTMAGLEVTGIHGDGPQAVFDIEVTPNRADCLSIIGIAREVAAITGQPLKLPTVQSSKFKVQSQNKSTARAHATPIAIRITDAKGCARYIGRLIEGVTITPSPDWIQRRLSACGIRPINNVVDVTNYVLLEYGQPLHAFDFDRLRGGAIVVRRAKLKEPITTLDGIARTLSPEMLVIADAERAVAVAGIMGGAGSEVAPSTKRIVLESAQFDPILIRRAGRALGLASESSYRFERGVDPVGVEAASARAASLIIELAGGALQAVERVGAAPVRRPAIVVDEQRVSRWLGTPVSSSVMRSTLARLSCRVASSGSGRTVQVHPPSFRKDLARDVDVIEELARAIGYDRLPASRSPALISGAGRDPIFARTEALRRLCAGLGLWEIMTWALIAEADLSGANLPASGSETLRLSNPLSRDHALLRPSLVPGLLHAAAKNLTHGASGVRLFELGNVFVAGPTPLEALKLGIVLGGAWEQTWQGTTPADLFRLKGIVHRIVERTLRHPLSASPIRLPWAEPGHSLHLSLAGRPFGVIGQVACRIYEAVHLEHPVWIAELDAELLVKQWGSAFPHFAMPYPFPPVKRDVSFIVDRSVEYARLETAIRQLAGPLAHHIELIDRYTGSQIPPAKHSLTFSIDYQDPNRTLTAAEADRVHRAIGEALVRDFGAQLR